ncbi:hypothetical protein JYQ62_16020 [Nostoc sp. UHCC 0702]|nr:hypothetical protein JYQ62_16020 [Nostoc sp. UHCC 0702]
MRNTRKYQANHVVYDLESKQTVSVSTPSTITFDSESEYQCYLVLCKMFPYEDWIIHIHHTITTVNLKWCVDFKIAPKKLDLTWMHKLHKLATAINGNQPVVPPTHLFVEYKGIQDKSFISKMKTLKLNHSVIASRLILVGRYDDAFGVYNSSCTKFETQPIIALDNLKQIWSEINNNGY